MRFPARRPPRGPCPHFSGLSHVRTSHPRHIRPALCQRTDPHRPPGRVHPDRHLGALPAHARTRNLLRGRRRHARHTRHAARGKGRHHPAPVDRARLDRAQARFRQLPGLVRQLPQHRLRREPRAVRARLPQAQGSGPDRRARGRAVLRPGQGNVPAGPLHQGRMPEVRRQGPIRRLLRGVRRDLPADRPEEPVFGGIGRHAGAQVLRALLLQAVRPALRDLPARMGGRPGPARGHQQDARVAGRRRRIDAVRLGHLARCAVLRLRDSRRAGQVFLRVAGCAGRLLRQLQKPVRQAGPRLRRVGVHALDRRAVPLHRQGHPVFPHAVLAGDAAVLGLPHADQRVRARLPDGGRRQDEQVARHLHHRAELHRHRPEPGMAALLLRRQAQCDDGRP